MIVIRFKHCNFVLFISIDCYAVYSLIDYLWMVLFIIVMKFMWNTTRVDVLVIVVDPNVLGLRLSHAVSIVGDAVLSSTC